MAAVESPDCPNIQRFSPDKLEPMDVQQSADPPASADTESLGSEKGEDTTAEVDSVGFAQKPSSDPPDSGAFTARAEEDADQTVTGEHGATENVPENHQEATKKGLCHSALSERELPSLDWSENEDPTAGEQTEGDPKDASPVRESIGEGDSKPNVTSEVGKTETSKVENLTEKENMETEDSVEQKEKRDSKGEEEANPAEEPSIQPKKRRMVCKECGKIFNRRETFNLHRHFHLHEDELKPLTCKVCGLTFQQRSSFIKHRNEHKENGSKPLSVKRGVSKGEERAAFKCAECATVFLSLNKLRNHRCNNSDELPFHCPICRQDFMYKVAMTKHMFTHSKDRLQCAECDQTFSDSASLRTHRHSHVSHKPYECPDCGMVFKQYSLMVDHRRKHTENSVSFPCDVCGKSFKYAGLLQQHQYLHTGQKPYTCSECGKKFAFAQNLKSHIRQHTLNLIPPEKPKTNLCNSGQTSVNRSEKENIIENNDVARTYNCPLCDQKYNTPANLRNHMHTHEEEYEMEGTSRVSKEPVKLDKSSDVLSDELSLNVNAKGAHKSELNHLNNLHSQPQQSVGDIPEYTDNRIRPFQCHDCGKSFRHRSVLELHKRIHVKDKSRQCKVCEKSFSSNSYLQQHLLIHTSERPFKCSDCDKDFTFLQTLKTHQKLHQEKPFRCNYCRKGYSDEAQLQHHLLSHNGEKPHKCNICDKRFGLAHQLRDHMNTHTGDRPHQCEVCHKSFTWLNSLLVHQKNAHKRSNTSVFNSFSLGDRLSDSSSDLREGALGLSRPFAGSDMVGFSSDTPRDAELGQMSDKPPSINAVGLGLKQQNKMVLSELPLPVQWKVDGGELRPAPIIQQTYTASQPFDNPSLSCPMPGKNIDTPHIMESSLSFVNPGSVILPKKSSPSSVPNIEQQRQIKTVPWSSPASTVASTSSLQTEFAHSGSFIDGAALWSIRPAAPNLSSHSSPKKPSQEVQFPTWQAAPMPQKDLSTPPKKEERSTWDMGSLHVQTVTPEKPWAPGLQSAPPLVQMAAQGIGTRWDIQTSPSLQQTLNSPDRLVTNADFLLQQKQVSPSWAGVQSPTTAPNVPISIQYDPHRFGQTIGAPVWAFQSNPVGPQGILKPGNVQELQHQQQIAAGTKIILNQPPFFPLPPMALAASHPLGGLGALSRPPHPNMFFNPQAVAQTLSLPQLPAQREPHKLPRLAFPPDRLHQCMICGCSLPREVDLQMHYMQHAQGKI